MAFVRTFTTDARVFRLTVDRNADDDRTIMVEVKKNEPGSTFDRSLEMTVDDNFFQTFKDPPFDELVQVDRPNSKLDLIDPDTRAILKSWQLTDEAGSPVTDYLQPFIIKVV